MTRWTARLRMRGSPTCSRGSLSVKKMLMSTKNDALDPSSQKILFISLTHPSSILNCPVLSLGLTLLNARSSWFKWLGMDQAGTWTRAWQKINAQNQPSQFFRNLQQLTPDALMLMYILKVKEGLTDRVLALLYGYEGPQPVNVMLRKFRDWIYRSDPWLRRQRNLSDDK